MNIKKNFKYFLSMTQITLILFVMAGCEKAPDAGGRATGIVTFNGKPLADATVFFHPADVGSGADGTTDANGKFELRTSRTMPGVWPGEYKVCIESWKVFPGGSDETGKTYGGGLSNIPRKYTKVETSGFTATVTAAGPNDYKFDLTGEVNPTKDKVDGQKE